MRGGGPIDPYRADQVGSRVMKNYRLYLHISYMYIVWSAAAHHHNEELVRKPAQRDKNITSLQSSEM